ncbi:MAG: signal peptidase II [Rhodococcus sp. (in: high G+C Gram-positive bacteria)]
MNTTNAAATDTTIPVRRDHRRLALIVAGLAATADLTTKMIATRTLSDRPVQLPGPIDLHLSYNSGIAFGLGHNIPSWVTIALTSTVVIALAIALIRNTLPSQIALGLVLGGATANVLDRATGDSVVDMLHTGWWPTFNLADIFITTGIALFVLNNRTLNNRT